MFTRKDTGRSQARSPMSIVPRESEPARTTDDGRYASLTSVLRRSSSVIVLALLAVLAAACSQSGSLQIMGDQPRYGPLDPSTFFPDGASARPVVPDTFTFRQPLSDTLLYQGMTNGKPATAFPFPVTEQVVARGQQRYNIYCTPCHGAVGDGNGIVVQRGLCCPASFHTDTLRAAPVGHFFDVITNGFGQMPSYASQIPVRDRWAIIAYVRALQLSQHATLGDVPPDKKGELQTPTPTPTP